MDEEIPRQRAAIVIDEGLGAGHATNAAAVVAITLSALVPGLPGADLIDQDGVVYPGLIPIGVTVLATSRAELGALHERAMATDGVVVVGFPHQGQQTKDYDEYRRRVASTPSAEIEMLALGLHGLRSRVGRLVGHLSLLR